MTELYHTATQLPLFPEKRCTGPCNRLLPATTEYFGATKLGKYSVKAECKSCHAKTAKTYKVTMINLICNRCGKAFQRVKTEHNCQVRKYGIRAVYCSIDCQGGDPIPDTIADEYIQGKTCQEIAKKYGIQQNRIKRRLVKLGVTIRTEILPATRERFRERGRRQFSTPESREQCSQRMMRWLSEGKIRASSKLEDVVALELSRRGVAFNRQHGINKPGSQGFIGCVDFMLADGRVIEVNGTYWHTDPRAYPDGPKYERQRVVAAIYEKKARALAELGIPLIELWEIDLLADLTGAIDKALAS